jgi:hypothetical protein
MGRAVITKTTTCPTCRAVPTKDGNKAYPFCCERCQLIDLGRWLDERYRIPGEPVDPSEIDPEGTND